MKVKHIVISRLWFEDKELMDKYLSVAKEVLIPALKRQTCKDFEFGIIVKNEDIEHVRSVLDIDFTAFSGMEEFKSESILNKYTIQTRQDIDDWISDNYIETIQQTYRKEYDYFTALIIHAHPVRVSYPSWEESEMREYNGKHNSMFLSLCQKEVKHTVFDRQHGSMYILADKVIKLQNGYAKWLQHPHSVNSTRDKVRGEKILSGPDNVLHVWVDKPPKESGTVTVRYINGKIKEHNRRYAMDLAKKGIAKIIADSRVKPAVVKGRTIAEYDKDYRIGIVIVCYQTPELIVKAVSSVVTAKGVRVMIVDNSPDGSECYKECDKLALYKNVDVIHTGENIFHGPALNKGIDALTTEYICVMDSDAEVLDHDVFDICTGILGDKSIYAVGGSVENVKKGNKPYYGVAFDYLKPWFGMLRMENFYRFSPFVHHGAPWCQSMLDIKGTMKVVRMPDAGNYVRHESAGTHKVAQNTWHKGWHKPIARKYLNITMICFVYNEMLYLPHVVTFWKNQGINIYVIDNMSTDGTWEWLQEQKIPSHRFDTKEMFHLTWLQEEVVKTLHKIKPDWVIYGAADLYYGFGEPVKNVIVKAERSGYNQIQTSCWFAVNTGEKRNLPLMDNYFWCKPFVNVTMISKYHPEIKFVGDHINIPGKRVLRESGLVLNYGSCKTKEEQEMKLARRQKAWDAGMNRVWGSHYRSGKEIGWMYDKATNGQKLVNIKERPEYKYYKNMKAYAG